MDIIQRLFKSVSGKTRLDILFLLLERKELSVSEISSILGRKLNTVSRNLRILEKDNFIKAKKSSKNVFYSIKKQDKYHYNLDILKILKKRLKEVRIFENKN